MRALAAHLACEWVDYWDESRVVSGLLAQYPVPLGREPIFVRQGALIPLDVERDYAGHGTRESKGSLTVLVYPSGTSSFRYRESARTPWITFARERLVLRRGRAPRDREGGAVTTRSPRGS